MLVGFLLLAVLHNGMAASWSVAPDVAPPADTGMSHHDHESMAHPDSGGQPMNHTSPDCCDTASCDCGCTATPAVLLPPATAARDWVRGDAARAPVIAEFRAGPTGAPFRPPA